VKTRSIHVDSRYMLWNMTEVDGAAHLVKEMNPGPAPAAHASAKAPSAPAAKPAK